MTELQSRAVTLHSQTIFSVAGRDGDGPHLRRSLVHTWLPPRDSTSTLLVVTQRRGRATNEWGSFESVHAFEPTVSHISGYLMIFTFTVSFSCSPQRSVLLVNKQGEEMKVEICHGATLHFKRLIYMLDPTQLL